MVEAGIIYNMKVVCGRYNVISRPQFSTVTSLDDLC